MLICGFEKFDNYYVRIDILERLFLMIIDKNTNDKIKLVPEMLNLLGCSKENFVKLMEKMNYKSFSDDQEVYFKYNLKKKFKKVEKNKIINDDNPFNILENVSNIIDNITIGLDIIKEYSHDFENKLLKLSILKKIPVLARCHLILKMVKKQPILPML